MKYLVQWKGFTVENDIWKREEDLQNAKKVIAEERSCQRGLQQRCCMDKMVESLRKSI